jgi:hypothetical protein
MMTEAFTRPAFVARVSRRRGDRAVSLGVRAWTGRSAILSATTSPRPPIATTETGTTRVSGMRLSARTIGQLAIERPVVPGRIAFARREAGEPPLTSG